MATAIGLKKPAKISYRQALEELALRKARTSLHSFIAATMPKFIFSQTGYHDTICNHLDAVKCGDITKLIITLPPRHSKTEMVARRFIPYYIGDQPEKEIIYTSYSQELAEKTSRDIRRIIRSPMYPIVFPQLMLDKNRNAAGEWETTQGGTVCAQGIGGSITGRGADLLVIDDPFKNRIEAESRIYRERVADFLASTAYTRLSPNGAIVLMMNRWNTDDPVGRIEAGDDRDTWTVLHLPALSEEDTVALFPERWPVSKLLKIRQAIGEFEFNCLYQGLPRLRGGQYINSASYKYVEEEPKGLRWIRLIDPAAEQKKSADYSASLKMAKDHEGNIFISSGWHARLKWPQCKQRIVEVARIEGPEVHILFEAVAGFITAYEEAREATAGIAYVEKVKVHIDSLARALGYISAVDAGKVHLVRTESSNNWIPEFLYQSECFPSKSAHDDYISCASMGYKKLTTAQSGIGIM